MAESPELREWPQTRIEWRIKKFWELWTKVGFCLKSPPFFLSDSKWYIHIYLICPEKTNSESLISLYLSKDGPYNKEQYVEFYMGIKNCDGAVMVQTLKKVHKFSINDTRCRSPTLIRIFTLHTSNAVSPEGTLTIFCSAAIVEESRIPITKSIASQTSSPSTKKIKAMEAASQTLYSDAVPTLIEDFKNLYLSKRFADVTITVNGREFFAHKNVLTSRSTVFSSMFNSDMTEKNSGKVEIADCDQDIFEEFLLFLYTGKLDIVTPSNAPSLYGTADKYDVQELKAECVRCMINDVSIDTFCDVMRLATMHDETEILQAATHFFIENAENILVTLKWQNFSVANPSVGNELVLKFVHKYKYGQR